MAFSTYVEQEIGRLESKGENHIFDLVRASTEENLQLEFKTKKEPSEKQLHRDDKQNLGKLISGFSNAEGGVAIWGIATEKNENSIDKAIGTRPISNIADILEIFRNQIATSVQPENPGIKVLSIRSIDDSDKGYIAVAVPKGPMRPYMSKAPDHNKYFRRTSFGFQPLEHYEVVDMIRSGANASFDLRWRVRHQNTMGHGHQLCIDIYFYNFGQIQADEPYAFFSNWPRSITILSMNGAVQFDPPDFGNRAVFVSPALEMLIPQGYLHFARIEFHLTEPLADSLPRWGSLPSPRTETPSLAIGQFRVAAVIGAKNSAARESELVISDQEVYTKCIKLLTRSPNT